MAPIEFGSLSSDGVGNYHRTWLDTESNFFGTVRTITNTIPTVQIEYSSPTGETGTLTALEGTKIDARTIVSDTSKAEGLVLEAIDGHNNQSGENIFHVRY